MLLSFTYVYLCYYFLIPLILSKIHSIFYFLLHIVTNILNLEYQWPFCQDNLLHCKNVWNALMTMTKSSRCWLSPSKSLDVNHLFDVQDQVQFVYLVARTKISKHNIVQSITLPHSTCLLATVHTGVMPSPGKQTRPSSSTAVWSSADAHLSILGTLEVDKDQHGHSDYNVQFTAYSHV